MVKKMRWIFVLSLVCMNLFSSSESSLTLYKRKQVLIGTAALGASLCLTKKFYKIFNQDAQKLNELSKKLSLHGIELKIISRSKTKTNFLGDGFNTQTTTTLKAFGKSQALKEHKEEINTFKELYIKIDSEGSKFFSSIIAILISSLVIVDGAIELSKQ